MASRDSRLEHIASHHLVNIMREPATNKIRIYPQDDLTLICQAVRSSEFARVWTGDIIIARNDNSATEDEKIFIPADIRGLIIYWWVCLKYQHIARWAALYSSCLQRSIYPWEPHVFDCPFHSECMMLCSIFSVNSVYVDVAGTYATNRLIPGMNMGIREALRVVHQLRKLLALPPVNPETITIAKRLLGIADKLIETNGWAAAK